MTTNNARLTQALNAGWVWRKGEQFVEFRLFDSAGHTLEVV